MRMIIVEVVNMIDTKNLNLNKLSTATREKLESLGVWIAHHLNGNQHLEELIAVSWR